jgi:hypothetical protein
MNAGKTLFAQVMEFVPWKTFGRIIAKHKGDCGVRTLSCADLFEYWRFPNLHGASHYVISRFAWRLIRRSCFTWGWRSRLLAPR